MVELTSSATYRHGSRSGRPPFARRFWPIHHRQRIRLWGMAFVLPTLLFFAVFKYGPMVWAIELSFNSYDMVSQPHFVGLDNYRVLAADPIFRETLINTFVYIAGSTILTTAIGLALALAINTGIPGARYCMTAMFLTNLMPIIAVCLIWRFLLHPYGLVNQILQPLGFGRIDWLTSAATAIPALILATVWRSAPYVLRIFLAALVALPDASYRASALAGAAVPATLILITLPLLLRTTIL